MNIGPFRVNASKSGVGFSVGEGPFRTGVTARGRKYVSAGVPGTGLRYDQTVGQGQGQGGGISGWIAAAGMFAWQYFFKGK